MRTQLEQKSNRVKQLEGDVDRLEQQVADGRKIVMELQVLILAFIHHQMVPVDVD